MYLPESGNTISLSGKSGVNMNVKVCALTVLSLAMATFLLVHFGLILAYGQFYIYENNPVVLWLEITMVVAIIMFGAYCLIDELQKSRRLRQ